MRILEILKFLPCIFFYMSKLLAIGIVLLVIAIVLWIYSTGFVEIPEEAKNCVNDEDCIVFGETGDCNCGCFNKDYQWVSGGQCFCAAPTSCKCVNGKCEGVFEEMCNGMSLTEAKEIAINSECGDRLKENYMCNEYTGTWWIDLDIEKEGCNPACVVNVETGTAEINWRCTGLIE